ncbi:MAG: TolC family protein [candidate division WOR-3 bacterium]|nr:TolC family protein [candidate division WOR-3 bacterium]
MIILSILFLEIDTLSLQEAIDIALKQSPTYLESRENLAKSRVQFYKALSYLLPTTSTTSSWTKSEYQSLTTERYTGSINFSMPVFDLDVISSIVVARGQEKGTSIQHSQEIANLVLNIKKSYYNLITAYELLNSSQKALERAVENKKLVETKYELGAASRLELLQAEVFYLQTLQNHTRAKNIEIQAQQEIKSLLMIEHHVYPADALSEPDTLTLPSLDSLKNLLFVANLNIRLSRQMHSLARTNLWLSSLAFLPRISVFYGYNTSIDSFSLDFDYLKDNATKNYGINISFPIFDIKQLIFNYLNAKKELKIKRYNLERTVLESEKALYTSYYNLQESIDKLRLSRKSLELAEEAIIIAKEQYNLGVISLLDLLRTEEDYYNARVNYVQALNDYYLQKATLSYVLGKTILGEQ